LVSWVAAWRWYAWFYRRRVSTDPGLASSGSESGSRKCNCDHWTPGDVRGRGPRAPCVRICERPDPEPWWGNALEGEEPQESTDGTAQAWPRLGRRPNGLPGGAKLRSGRAGRLPASLMFVGVDGYVRRTCASRRPA